MLDLNDKLSSILKTKKYKKYLVPYNRKTKIKEGSINNLKYIKNKEIKNKSENKLNENNVNIVIIGNTIENSEMYNQVLVENNTDTSILCKEALNDNSKNIDLDINKENEDLEKNNDFINVDLLFNEEIDNSNCDDCRIMDNNILYLSDRLKKLYLNVLKDYDDIIDITYYVNLKLEELINVQNIRSKEMRIKIYNIIQNKKKLDINDISIINNTLTDSEYEIPHISSIFRNKIVDPLVENLSFIKDQYNEYKFN